MAIQASIRAKTYCNMFTLSKGDLDEMVGDYPDLIEKMQATIKDKFINGITNRALKFTAQRKVKMADELMRPPSTMSLSSELSRDGGADNDNGGGGETSSMRQMLPGGSSATPTAAEVAVGAKRDGGVEEGDDQDYAVWTEPGTPLGLSPREKGAPLGLSPRERGATATAQSASRAMTATAGPSTSSDDDASHPPHNPLAADLPTPHNPSLPESYQNATRRCYPLLYNSNTSTNTNATRRCCPRTRSIS